MKSRDYFRTLTVIHTALLTGQILFALLAYYLNSNGKFFAGENLKGKFSIPILMFMVGIAIASKSITDKRLKSIREKTDLGNKLQEYRSALIVKFALLEAPILLAIVVYLMTATISFVIMSGALIGRFILLKPTRKSIITDLELDQTEVDLIDDPEAIIA